MMMLIMEAMCQATTMITILLRSLMMIETLWQVTTPPSHGLVLGPEMLI